MTETTEEQLTFKNLQRSQLMSQVKAVASEFDSLCRMTTREIDRADFAAIVDKSYSTVSDVLNSNLDYLNGDDGGKRLQYPLLYLITLAIVKPDRFRETVLKFLADITCTETPRKKRERTHEEENHLIWRIIKSHQLEPLFEEIRK